MDSMYVHQPASSTKKYWFSSSVEVNVTIVLLSEGAGSMLTGLTIILHLKYDKKVYIIINFFFFVSRKSLNCK